MQSSHADDAAVNAADLELDGRNTFLRVFEYAPGALVGSEGVDEARHAALGDHEYVGGAVLPSVASEGLACGGLTGHRLSDDVVHVVPGTIQSVQEEVSELVRLIGIAQMTVLLQRDGVDIEIRLDAEIERRNRYAEMHMSNSPYVLR